jgi:hypothetical protein
VLHGALNKVLWNQIVQNPSIKHFQFEELCLDPIDKFKGIFEELDLPYTDSTLERHRKLCFMDERPVESYHPHAIARNSRAMACSWKEQLDSGVVSNIRKIWLEFEIPLYADDISW